MIDSNSKQYENSTEWILPFYIEHTYTSGLAICIMEDSHGFILHSFVCPKTTYAKVAVTMVEATQAQFPSFNTSSFDKGFHSPENQKELKTRIEQVVLPKKGKQSKADQEREYAPEFRQAKK